MTSGSKTSPRATRIAAWPVGPLALRSLDIAIALTGLVLALPLVVCVIAALWLESGRPFFYRQTRLGYRGRPFRIVKFRKFDERRPVSTLAVTLANDSRMTRVGRMLQRSKLDEIPQLWNVLIGDMAIVGPRPESLSFADCFSDEFSSVLLHKPGILGPSQILFRNEDEMFVGKSDPEQFYRQVLFPLKARVDLLYFPRRSVRGDLEWIVRTVLAVLGASTFSLRPLCDLSGPAPLPTGTDPAIVQASSYGCEATRSPRHERAFPRRARWDTAM